MSALHFRQALLPDGWAHGVRVVLAGGRIAAIETDVRAAESDEHHGVLLPGLCNAHSHAFQRAMAGLAELRTQASRDSFWTWREQLYSLAARLEPDDLEAIAAFAFAEMLECGFTRVGEFHYVHHARDGRPYADPSETSARIAAAAAGAGIRLTLLPVFYAHGGFGGREPSAGQRRFVTDEDSFARVTAGAARHVAQLPDGRLGIAPHSLRAVTPAQLHRIVDGSRELPLHLHVAEQQQEVDEALVALGRRPVEWLLDEFEVDARWTLVHATHADQGELTRLGASGATLCICPITEANLGDGLCDVAAFVGARGSLAIGSDSNVLIDAAGELRLLEYGQRLRKQARNVLCEPGRSTGRTLFELALHGGSRSLGASACGLRAGGPADFFTLSPALVAAAEDALEADPDRLLDAWIFATPQTRVADAWCDGARRVRDGVHVERETLERRYREALRRLRAR